MHYNQGWDIEAVRRICWYFYKTTAENEEAIGAFLKLLPVAAVCRVWRNFMLPYVYKTGYLERRHKGDSERMWISNIDLIVSQNLSTQVRELHIASSREDGISNVPTALDAFGFSSAYWSKVSRLTICDNYAFDGKSQVVSDESDDIRSTQIKDYFAFRTPNIHYLKLRLDDKRSINCMFTNKMANLYLNQLYELDSGIHIPVNFHANRFGENLTRLNLRIITDIAKGLPQIMASQLQCLILYGIPEYFSWNIFYSGSPTAVTFANLQYLNLQFSKETVSKYLRKTIRGEDQIMRIINQDANNRKLCFPRLQKLSLVRNPYSDAAFYERFVASPLRNLRIIGSFKSMRSIHAHTLLNLSYLRLSIHSLGLSKAGAFSLRNGFSPSEEEELSVFTKKLFGSASHVEKACFDIYEYTVILSTPYIIGWLNLRQLALINSVCLSSVVNFVTQCPRLEKLFLGRVVNDIEDIDATLYEIINHGPTHTRCVNGMLRRLRIFDPTKSEYTSDLSPILYLVLTIQSLRKVLVPTTFVAGIEYFITNCSARFPRLNSVEVRKDPLLKTPQEGRYLRAVINPFSF